MENQNYKCFEEAIEKVERIKSAAEYLVLGNELEALLRLSTSDYLAFINEYSVILDKLDNGISKKSISKENLKSNLIRLYGAIEMITPLTKSMDDINVDDLAYEGDKETSLQFIKYLTNECSRRTIGLAKRIEQLVNDNGVIPNKKRLQGKLKNFIIYCQDLRRNKEVISYELYCEFNKWKSQLENLATAKNGDSDLITKGLAEISLIYNLYEFQSKFSGKIFNLGENRLKTDKSTEKKKQGEKAVIDEKRMRGWY